MLNRRRLLMTTTGAGASIESPALIRMIFRRALRQLLLASILVYSAAAAQAQTYPSNVVRIVVPYAAGGTADITARLIADRLTKHFNQSFIVENKAGAATAIAARTVVAAPPDGYTLLLGVPTTTALTPVMMKNPGYSPDQLVPIAIVMKLPQVLVVPASLPVSSVRELIEYARSRPGELNFGTQGSGGFSHLITEQFMSVTGTKMTAIHYRGSAPALTGMLTGDVSVYFDAVSSTLPFISSGKIKVLAVAGEARVPALPGVPTLKESGVPVESIPWFGLMAPAGTPQDVVKLLNDAVTQITRSQDIEERFARDGASADFQTPAELQKYIATEQKVWRSVISSLGLKME